MRSEQEVPLQERVLVFTGRASGAALNAVKGGIQASIPRSARCLFAMYSYADLPIGKEFEVVFPLGNPTSATFAASRILAVTQQFAKPWDELPHGWKTLCVLDFPGGVPALVDQMPEKDDWGDGQGIVGVCSRATLEAIQSQSKGGPP